MDKLKNIYLATLLVLTSVSVVTLSFQINVLKNQRELSKQTKSKRHENMEENNKTQGETDE